MTARRGGIHRGDRWILGHEVAEGLFAGKKDLSHVETAKKPAQRFGGLYIEEYLRRDEDQSAAWRQQLQTLLEEEEVKIEAAACPWWRGRAGRVRSIR